MANFNPNDYPSEEKATRIAKERVARSKERRPQAKTKKLSLAVTAKVLGEVKPEDLSKGVVYAFTKGGKLLGKTGLNARGASKLELLLPAVQSPQSLRIIIGPNIEEEPSISELLRRGGEEAFARIDPDITQKKIVIQVIPKHILCWLLSACVVQGKIVKKTVSGGISMDLPVCDALVEVYEVDSIPILIPKLPDIIIERIREIIIDPPPPIQPPFTPPEHVDPFPPPPPPLVYGEKPVTELMAKTSKLTSLKQIANYQERKMVLDASTNLPSIVADDSFQTLRVLAHSTSTEQFRKALVDHASLVKYVLCWLPFGTIHMDLVATAKTAECGKFKALFFRGCKNPDIPDLYFKVKQKIFPFFPPLTIFAPTPVPCHTYWNYQCGTQEVLLHVTHPLAVACAPCPPIDAPSNWVLFMAIGNLPLSKIRGTSIPFAGTTNVNNVGLTNADAPFGELLRPRIEFDNSLREDLGVKYYRVSYRKGTSGPFKPLTSSINRHYTQEIGDDLVLEAYNLGPKVVNGKPNLFEIPPSLPPVGQWSIPNAVEDTASAKFQTTALAPLEGPGVQWPESGIYQLKVDLFDQNGNIVDIDTLGIKFRVPTSTDLSSTIYTDDAADPSLTSDGTASSTGLVWDDDGDGKKSMVIALHIDNSRCKAEFPAPTLDGTPAGVDCGIMRYTYGPGKEPQGTVTLKYRPEHPAGVGTKGFATFNFSLFRGENQLTSPIPLPPIPDSGRTPLPPTTLSTNRSVTELLGDCDTAGFAEHLYVTAKATSGWRQLHEYDAHAVRAFVLAPPSKSTGPPSP
jgi:hypothetical protein